MILRGIENENEFFPAGFFAGALETELNAAVSSWEDDKGSKSPVKRLSAVSVGYRQMIDAVRASPGTSRAEEKRREATFQFLAALGYEYHRKTQKLSDAANSEIPILSHVADADGRDIVWIVEAPTPPKDDLNVDPLGMCFEKSQFESADLEYAELNRTIEEILAEGVFGSENAPRNVLVLGLSQLVLVDRNKWPNRSVLRFDLHEIFSANDPDTLKAMTCFVSHEARAPKSGIPLADRLEEEAQRHANAVTGSLKETVRDAIELLGQEVLDVTGGKYPKGHSKSGVWIDGDELSLECLRYMYRLLFLFYAEANPKLGVLNVKDPVYASGYSLEALRELESVRLKSIADREGIYFWKSLQLLLDLLYSGTDQIIRLPAVKVSLLDPASTPILSNVTLRNEAVQKIIRLLSLKKTRRGTSRISYAQLGIGQLGAVYETLISFTGFVAKADLIELRPQAGKNASAEQEEVDDHVEDVEPEEDTGRSDKVDKLVPTYFVARNRAKEFKKEEIIYDGAEPRIYEKGSFVYRLAGRDREKSASYYTPEPLARLLVKHALMERCKDLKANELLELKILEPAMGSAAFLVETTNQLADLYLERKQVEVGRTIPQDEYFIERQKVRGFISDRNCFGVDLNPVAVELGAISMWLNSLHNSDFSPWFGDQLHAGNSLIGARRASYASASLTAGATKDRWLKKKPQEIGWKGRLPENHVWQFLLPVEDMAKFDKDKSIKEFAEDAQNQIKAWRKGTRPQDSIGFFDKFEEHEVEQLRHLSKVTEQLFDQIADDLEKSREQSNDAITLWPDMLMDGVTDADYRDKERRLKRLTGQEHVSNTLPYKRLKTAMDAWCALWLWPLDKAELLPARAAFLEGMRLLLEGGYLSDGSLGVEDIASFADPDPGFMDQLEQDAPPSDLFKAAAKSQTDTLFRETDVDELIEIMPWLQVATDVAKRERFTHFDLIFADVLRDRGGFDVIVGNPPWAQVSWNEGDIIGDIDPGFTIRKLSAKQTQNERSYLLSQAEARRIFLTAYASVKGAMSVTSSAVMNPYAGAGLNNLYRCFVDLSFRIVSPNGTAALIHQDGHLTDPKAVSLRVAWYARIVKHFHFFNLMNKKNFAEVLHQVMFSLNIYRGSPSSISFENFTNAFLASQVEDSYRHDGAGPIPTTKTDKGKWDTRGHADRIVKINKKALSSIHALTEDQFTPVSETRFLQPYSIEILDVFRTLGATPSLNEAVKPVRVTRNTGSGFEEVEVPGWQMSAIWHESGAQKDGTIKRETGFRPNLETQIISGPMFGVATPLSKCPNRGCKSHLDYEVIDLDLAPSNYSPRNNYAPSIDLETYLSRLPDCRWDTKKTHLAFNRLAFRKMVSLTGERSFIGSIIPKMVAHIDSVQSVAFDNEEDLLRLGAISASIVADFLIKVTGKKNMHDHEIASLPFPDPGSTAKHRVLRLNCLTESYSELWSTHAPQLHPLDWHKDDARLTLEGPVEGPIAWNRTAALRNDFARRVALIEIDVLVAQSLGLSLDQLIDIYRIYFPVLQQNEAATWYDAKGRIVWTASKGLPGVGYLNDKGKSPGAKDWLKFLETKPEPLECEGTVDFMPGGPQVVKRVFEGPFDTCNRIEDYKRAWAYFEAHPEHE